MHGNLRAVTRRTAGFTTPSGEKIAVASLGLGDLASAQEQALQEYRRDQIKAWTENADLMPNESRAQWIREAFDRAAAITLNDLPKMDVEVAKLDEQGKIVVGEDGKVVKNVLREQDYVDWWASQSMSGRLFVVWLSIKRVNGQEHITLEEADRLFMSSRMKGKIDESALDDAAQLVGDLTQSQLSGNLQPPPQRAGRKERRRRRRQTGP